MVGFLIRMLLGLALIALGFLFGAIWSLHTYYVPTVVMLQSAISPERANHIMNTLLDSDDEYENEANALASFFYICYKVGYICYKTPFREYFLDALMNLKRHKILLNNLEQYAKAKGVKLEKEKNDETGDK